MKYLNASGFSLAVPARIRHGQYFHYAYPATVDRSTTGRRSRLARLGGDGGPGDPR